MSDPIRCLKDQLYAVPHLDVFWYRLNAMGARKNTPEKVLATLFPYTFHAKTKLNIVYENLKRKIFSRDTNILLQMHWTSNSFGLSVATIGGFWVSLNYPIPNFNGTSKKRLMRHWYATFIFNNYRSFVNSLLHLVRSYVVMVFTYEKVAAVKSRKTRSLVMQLHISYQVNGHQENYGHHRREFRQSATGSSCC